MKHFFLCGIFVLIAGSAAAQVDIDRRRVLLLATGGCVANGDEAVSGIGALWFNENHYPWTNTALRIFYAGIFVDAELSWFVGGQTNTAVGAGAGGGFFADGLTPYRDGDRLTREEFYGDSANGRVFLNQTIPNPTPLPLNLRATYAVVGQFYREASSTKNLTLPNDHLVQSVFAEMRFGGIEPGLAARRGAEVYLLAEANYRSGFDAFGPVGAEYDAESKYTRLFGSLALKLPVGPATVYGRLCGGLGEHIDQLSAWKLGGNLINFDAVTLTIHGYYTREIFAEDFGLANLMVGQKLADWHELTGYLYGDWAVAHTVPPGDGDWRNYFGVGAGVGFRTVFNTRVLVAYGYGFNARRRDTRGGHELSLALEKQF